MLNAVAAGLDAHASRSPVSVGLALLVVLAAPVFSHAEDWPAYRRDAQRTAISGETLKFPLHGQWVYRTSQPPHPAWPEPGRALNSLDFDYAFQPVVAAGIVYFGSSGDDAVRALDAESGRLLWTFVTGGPIRFAPQVDADLLYVASDDGYVYCLNARTGAEVWSFRGGLDERDFIAQGRFASRWPARSGVLVRDGMVYVTMGMWPSEGVFFYALDAKTGRQVWCNDTDSTDYIEYPHAPSVAIGGPAPQGYLLAHDDVLIVPTGRSAPAGFDIRNGQRLYYHAGLANRGGTHVIIGDGRAFVSTVAWQPDQSIRLGESPPHEADSLAAFDMKTGLEQWRYTLAIKAATADAQKSRWRSAISAGIYSRQRAIFSGRRLFAMGNGQVDAFDLADGDQAPRAWSCEQPRIYSDALTANALLLGQAGAVVALDPATGKPLWRQAVPGQVRGLAISDGRVVVSNERGELFCFAAPANDTATVIEERTDDAAPLAAAEVLRQFPEAKELRGYALVVGEPDAKLAEALVAETQLHVVAVISDKKKVQTERQRLVATTGLYGKRLSVLPTAAAGATPTLPLVSYFANLMVVSGDAAKVPGRELYRTLRPCGGVMVFVNGASAAKTLQNADIPASETDKGLVRRGKLPGAFDWDSTNDADLRVRWPLEFQWFGEPGPQLITPRHARPATPIAANGRMFVFGEYHVTAVDAYNGTQLWRRRLNEFSVGSQGNPFADDDHLYLRQGKMVAQFNAATGELVGVYDGHDGPPVIDATKARKFETPTRDGQSGRIEINAAGDNLRIRLTTASPIRSVDDAWELAFDFRPPQQRLLAPGQGTFELIVQPWSAKFRQLPTFEHPGVEIFPAGDEQSASVVTLSIPWSEIETWVGWRPTSFAMAADVKLWQEDFRRGLAARPLATNQFFLNNAEAIIVVAPEALKLPADAALLSPLLPVPKLKKLPAHVPSESRLPLLVLADGNKDPRDATGNPWHATPRESGFELTQRESPFTLETGWRDYSRSYGCSGFSCSATTDFFRSGTIGIYDREDDSGMRNISGIRSGCGLTLLPAQGLLLYSESAADCTCGYSFATSLAMAPVETRRHEDWALFHQQQLTPGQIRQSALNFGAPGDRRDDDATLWLGYPRPRLAVAGGYASDLPFRVEILSGFGPARVNGDRTPLKDNPHGWIYASQLRGVSRMSMDMIHYQPNSTLVSLGGKEKPTLDGVLDDACWTDFGAVHPDVGRGTYYFRHDTENLYIGYREKAERDRRGTPTPWKTTAKGRDGRIDRDDHLRVSFRNLAESRVVTFGVNAAGVQFDSLLDFAIDVPLLTDVKLDGDSKDWKQDARSPSTSIALPGGAVLRLGWNQDGLCMLTELPKNFDGSDAADMGGLALLLGRDGAEPMQQLIINVTSQTQTAHGWRGEQALDAGWKAVAIDADSTTIESFVPWASLGIRGKENATLSLAIRYFDPKEPFFDDARRIPFSSARDRASQLRSQRGLTLRLSPAGTASSAKTEPRRMHYGYRAVDVQATAADQPAWNGQWRSRVDTTEDSFVAELSIPWKTLTDAGLQRDRLQMNLNKPLLVADAQDRVLPLLERQEMRIHTTSQPIPEKYVVRLHFAELDDVAPGQRVFDVMLQGKIVLKDFDVTREAGGRYKPVVKEFSNIVAADVMELRFLPNHDATNVPILSGIEIKTQ